MFRKLTRKMALRLYQEIKDEIKEYVSDKYYRQFILQQGVVEDCKATIVEFRKKVDKLEERVKNNERRTATCKRRIVKETAKRELLESRFNTRNRGTNGR